MKNEKSQTLNIYYARQNHRLETSSMPSEIRGYKYLLCHAKPQATNIYYAL